MTEEKASNLSANIAQFRAARARTLALIHGLTQEQMDYKPAPDVWSAGEIIDHMLLAETTNREQIERLVALKREGARPELRLNFADLNVSVAHIPRCVLPLLEVPLTLMNMFVPNGVRNYLTRNRLIPFQNPDQAAPRSGRSAQELRQDLENSLQETESLFFRNADLNFSEMFISHPLLGNYDAPGLLRFMTAHEQRHQTQLVNLLANPQFP